MQSVKINWALKEADIFVKIFSTPFTSRVILRSMGQNLFVAFDFPSRLYVIHN